MENIWDYKFYKKIFLVDFFAKKAIIGAIFSKLFSMSAQKILSLILWWILLIPTSFASPALESSSPFPIANQSKNACYYYSVNIALQAKYGTTFKMEKVLENIWFDGSSLTNEAFKRKFSNLTHVKIALYRHKSDLKRLLSNGEPVLVSTLIVTESGKQVRHVSVAYSYDEKWIYVSDPLKGKTIQIGWEEVFLRNGTTKYYPLRTVWIKPYQDWSQASKDREAQEDLWVDETKLVAPIKEK